MPDNHELAEMMRGFTDQMDLVSMKGELESLRAKVRRQQDRAVYALALAAFAAGLVVGRLW